MNAKILAVVIVFVTNIRVCQGVDYKNYALYRTVPTEKHHMKFLMSLETQNYINVIFWKRPTKLYEEVEFLVPRKDIAACRERIRHYGMTMKEIHHNIQELFRQQSIIQRYSKQRTETYRWEQFHLLEDINQWMTDMAKKYSTVCELLRIGKTYEERDIYALSISRRKPRATVIVEGGIHGNEWISTEFVTYLAENLLDLNTTYDARLVDVANNFQWYLIPVVNPDGYVYSHSTDRLWRKNRRKHFNNSTFGVDLNRNFNYSFCKFSGSNKTEDDRYCGPKPFSELETMVLSKFITDHSKNLQYYFAFHSYGQKIIIPYGDKILHVDNYGDCENYGKQALIKIYRKSGLKYSIGNAYEMLGQKISGDSASWVKKTFHVLYVYTFLLRDDGAYGYAMPPSEIIPACEETLTAVLEIMTTHSKKLRADIFSDSRAGDRISCAWLIGGLAFWLAK